MAIRSNRPPARGPAWGSSPGRSSATIPAVAAGGLMPSWSTVLCLLCLFAGAMGSPAAAQPAKRPMTPEDLWAMERVGDPELSPDGRWVVFSVNRFSVEDNQG